MKNDITCRSRPLLYPKFILSPLLHLRIFIKPEVSVRYLIHSDSDNTPRRIIMGNQNQHGNEENRNKSGQNAPGNFKNDPNRASEAGRKGAEQSQGERNEERE